MRFGGYDLDEVLEDNCSSDPLPAFIPTQKRSEYLKNWAEALQQITIEPIVLYESIAPHGSIGIGTILIEKILASGNPIKFIGDYFDK